MFAREQVSAMATVQHYDASLVTKGLVFLSPRRCTEAIQPLHPPSVFGLGFLVSVVPRRNRSEPHVFCTASCVSVLVRDLAQLLPWSFSEIVLARRRSVPIDSIRIPTPSRKR